jgi:hypothetical protein
MSPKKFAGLTYTEIIAQFLAAADGPVLVKKLSEHMLALHPSAAKKPMTAARGKIREAIGHLLVFLDQDTVLPIHMAMNGARFRLQLDADSINTGLVEVGNNLPAYLPGRFSLEKVLFVDIDAQPLEHTLKTATKTRTNPFFGPYDATTLHANLGNWLRKHNAQQGDDILFTVFDWQNGIFQLELETYAKREAALLNQRNQLLTDLFYEMLESSANEEIYQHEAIPTAYARLPDKSGYPPDHWRAILDNDKRIYADSWKICYRDGEFSPFEILTRAREDEPLDTPAVVLSEEQGNLAYRFKAELVHSPTIWREVEILGEQTLDDLNRALVHAFHHDWYHMGGFWNLVPRKGQGGKVRYREVDLGSVDPMGGGDGAEVKIAAIGLAEGRRMKYVYDFGDWIEHTLTLEAITPSLAEVDYPQETARNKPKYVHCVDCEQEGLQTIAKWICLTCSDERQKRMVYCKKCAENHEDHYLDEILY